MEKVLDHLLINVIPVALMMSLMTMGMLLVNASIG
jgi:hypothetical protein